MCGHQLVFVLACGGTVVEEVAPEQHGAQEVQPRQQEGSGAVRELLREEGEAHSPQGAARSRLRRHPRAHGRAGVAQARGNTVHL